jgi:hypothetical protein
MKKMDAGPGSSPGQALCRQDSQVVSQNVKRFDYFQN